VARIGTWNVQNFFRPDSGAPDDEDAYQAKLASLAETIKAMAPDVLAVQEVGDPEALADLATAVGGPWNLAPRIPEANRYSRIYHARPELIDHILASHAVTVRVADGDIDFAGPRPHSIGDDPNADSGAPASDHRPLLLAVDLPA
jgi:predicted extracellular nuclease